MAEIYCKWMNTNVGIAIWWLRCMLTRFCRMQGHEIMNCGMKDGEKEEKRQGRRKIHVGSKLALVECRKVYPWRSRRPAVFAALNWCMDFEIGHDGDHHHFARPSGCNEIFSYWLRHRTGPWISRSNQSFDINLHTEINRTKLSWLPRGRARWCTVNQRRFLAPIHVSIMLLERFSIIIPSHLVCRD